LSRFLNNFIFFLSFILSKSILVGNVKVESLLADADSLFWFAMEEDGNSDALKQALELIGNAESILNQNSDSKLAEKCAALKTDLLGQLSRSEDTLFGKFPLLRFSKESLFQNNLALGTYEVVDNPLEKSVVSASKNMIELIQRPSWKYDQCHIFFLASGSNHNLESEAAYLFNQDSRFWLHSRSELVGLLGQEEINSLYDEGNWEGKLEKFFRKNESVLKKSFGNSNLLAITIDVSEEAISKNRICTLTGHLFQLGSIAKDTAKIQTTFSSYGFARDRNHVFWPCILIGALCFLFVLSGNTFKIQHEQNNSGFRFWLVFAFVLGFIFPNLAAVGLSSFSPEAESLWWLSIWWPFFIFLLYVVGPKCFIYILKAKLPKLFFKDEVNNVILGRAVGLGLACSLGADILIYSSEPDYAWNGGMLFSIAGLGSAIVLFLPSLENVVTRKESWNGTKFIISCIGIFGLCSWGYWSADAWILTAGAVMVGLTRLETKINTERSVENVESVYTGDLDSEDLSRMGQCPSISWLRNQCVKPGFVKFDQFHKSIEVIGGNDPCILSISGPSGSGKNRWVREISSEVKKRDDWTVLSGACSDVQESGPKIPFSLFRSLLGEELFKSQVCQESENNVDLIGSSFLHLIPALGLAESALSGLTEDQSNTFSSQQEMFSSITHALLQIAKPGGTLILNIENLHAIDSESDGNLVRELLSWSPPPEKISRLILIFTSEKENSMEDLLDESAVKEDFKIHKFSIGKEQVKNVLRSLLARKLMLDQSIFEQIFPEVVGDEIGCLDWVFDSIQKYCRDGEIYPGDKGKFQMAKGRKTLSPPDGLRQIVFDQLNAYPEHRSLIRFASMIGERFQSTELVQILGSERKKILIELEKVEEDTGIIQDLPMEDDWFHITPLKRKFAKEFFRVTEEGPVSSMVPQVVRESHAMIALGYERSDCKDLETLSKVANHYFFAGRTHAANAIQFNLKLAQEYSTRFQFATAGKHLDMAEEYAETKEEINRIRKDRLRVLDQECSTKRDLDLSKARLEKCSQYLENCFDSDPEVELIMLRARHEYADEEAVENEKKSDLWKKNVSDGERLLKELDKQTEMAGKRAEILQFMALARSRLFGLKSESDGVSKIFQDEHSDVLDLYKRAIDELELDSNQTARLKTARIHDSLAYFHREFADPNNPEDSLDLSIEHYEKSILIKRRFEDRLGLAISLSGLASLQNKIGAHKEAIQNWKEAGELNLKIGSFEFAARTFLKISSLEEKKDAAVLSLQKVRDILNSGELGQSEDARSIAEEVEKISTSLDSTISNENV